MSLLVAEHLYKSFGKVEAVKDVSLRIDEGECVAFLGPNGAGKTTTVEILEGLTEADKGDVSIFGLDIRKKREEILQSTGVLLQETNLYKKLTVKETLSLFASFYTNAVPIDPLIDAMQLTEKSNQRLEALSGGQKQRVYIACGLINNPKLFFLDEPTTGLDPQARRMIWKELANLKANGCSLLLTTHYMEEAEFLADRVLIIDHGEIIAQGTPSELIEKFCGTEQLLLDCDPSEMSTVKDRIKALHPLCDECVEVGGRQLVVQTSNAIQGVRDLAPLLDESDSPIKSIQVKRSNLEDVFLKITGRSIRDV